MLARAGDIPVSRLYSFASSLSLGLSCLRFFLYCTPQGKHRNLNYCSLRSRAARIKADFRGAEGRGWIGAIINS